MCMKKIKHILVADDEAEIREILKETLENNFKHVQVTECSDGADAVRRIAKQQYDLAIFDIKMPRLDGSTALKSLKELPVDFRPKRVLVYSGHGKPEDIPLLSEGVYDFLPKPTATNIMISYLRLALGEEKADSAPDVPKPKFDSSLIAAFVDTAADLIKQKTAHAPLKESLFVRNDCLLSGDVSVLLTLSKMHPPVTMAFNFDKSCFLHVVNGMGKKNYFNVNSELYPFATDFCQEVLTLVAEKLKGKNYSFEAEKPKVIIANEGTTENFEGNSIVVRLRCHEGWLNFQTMIYAADAIAEAKMAV